jgi:hypothetical protein
MVSKHYLTVLDGFEISEPQIHDHESYLPQVQAAEESIVEKTFNKLLSEVKRKTRDWPVCEYHSKPMTAAPGTDRVRKVIYLYWTCIECKNELSTFEQELTDPIFNWQLPSSL